MTTKREVIIQTVVARLQAAGIAGVNGRVFRSRQEALSRAEAPAIIVTPEGEAIEENLGTGPVDKRLTLTVDVYARSLGTESPEQAADATVQAVHGTIMTDTSLGGLCIDVTEGATQWAFDDADASACIVSTQYVCWYRHRRENIAG